MRTPPDLNIAEISYGNGELHFRFARYLSEDGSRWIMHGLFQEYHPNGQLISEGMYEHGVEQGLWKDHFPNGQPAAEGRYDEGQKIGEWRYWNEDGTPQLEPPPFQ
jgi:hypothetical protein